MASDPASVLRTRRTLAGAMILASLVMLAVSWSVRMREPGPGVPLLAYLATAYALLSPVQAAFIRRREPLPRADITAEIAEQELRARTILTYLPLEAAVMFCGLAVILGPFEWPLVAAAVPLALMIVWFPRPH